MASINQCANETKQSIHVNGVEDSDLLNTFNLFFSCFERSEFSENVSTLRGSLVPQNDIVILQECVTAPFKSMNIRKTTGLDAICGRTLRYCAEQLSEVITKLFQMCAELGQIPIISKTSTIIPIPKSKQILRN